MSIREPILLDAPGTGESPAPLSAVGPVLLAVVTILCCFVAYALAVGNENQVIAGVVGILGLVIVIARPFWGLLFFVGLLYTRPEETIPSLAGMHLPLVISLTTLVGLLLQMALKGEWFVRSPVNFLILGFVGVATASAVQHGNWLDALQDTGRLGVLLLLFLNLVRTESGYETVVTSILVFTGFLAAFSAYLYFTGAALQYDDGSGVVERAQATGIFSDPNDLAATMVPALALALFRAYKASRYRRWAYAGLSALIVSAIFLTNSRGGLLALMVVVGTFIFLITRRKVLAALLAGVVCAGLLFGTSGRMTNFDSQEASSNQRFWYWSNGYDQLVESPVLGVGYAGFLEINGGMTAHNSFVLCFTELGLVGYTCWMGCLYCCFQGGRRPARKLPATETALTPLTAARIGCAGMLVACFFLSRTYAPVTYLIMGLPLTASSLTASSLTASSLTASSLTPGNAGPEAASRWHLRDTMWLLGLTIASIAFIKAFSDHMK